MGSSSKEVPISSSPTRLTVKPIDRFFMRVIPREIFEDDVRSRTRVLLLLRYVVVGAFFTAAFFPYFVFHLKIPYTASANALYGASLILTPLVLRWTRSISAASHWTIACAFLVLLFQAAVLGGVSSLAFPWLVVVPIAGMLLLGTRGGLCWTVITVTSIIGLGLADSFAWLPAAPARAIVGQRVDALTVCALAIALSAIGWLFETRANTLLRHVERQRKTYHDRSVRDVLTGLANRALLSECIIQSWERCRRNGPRAALFFVDLNHFKQVNDRYGHLIGDQVLKEVALRLKDVLRRSDIAGRIGGDEFALVIEGIESRSDVAALAEKVASAIEVPIELEQGTVQIGASIGIAIYPDHPYPREESPPTMTAESTGVRHNVGHETVRRLLQRADAAMYAAKRQGRRYWIHGDRPSGEHRLRELA